MRILIRIVFVIFIANGIECLGKVCDNCCDCFKEKDKKKQKEEGEGEGEEEKKDEKIEGEGGEEKKEEIEKYEEIKEEGDNTAISLVNDDWLKNKKNPVLKIFKKKDNNEDNEDKILIKLEGKDNTKITYLQKKEDEDPLKLNEQKYALFEIKTQKEEEKVYLYCDDVESFSFNGIFERKPHVSISVIACNTTTVEDIAYMFYNCNSLTKLDLKNFNTTNVTDMRSIFSGCSSLTELNLKNFNTTNVRDMGFMFSECSSLKEIDLKNFNTINVTNMESMFSECSSLTKLDLKDFNTTNVTNMEGMFYGCSNLKEINFGQNFNTTNVTNMNNMFRECSKLTKLDLQNFNTEKVTKKENMFFGCNSFPEDIQNKNVEGIINFFKGKNK